ncbi:hypothetical protein ACF0H5_000918 [Mactra antiquata]
MNKQYDHDQQRELDEHSERTQLLPIDQNKLNDDTPRKRKKPTLDEIILVISAVLLSGLSIGFGNGLSVLYPVLVQVFQVDRSIAALVQGTNISLCIAGAVLWTQFIKRYGCGFCIKCGVMVSVISVFLGQFSVNIWMVIVFVGIFTGIGMSIVSLGVIFLVNDVLSDVPWKSAALAAIPVGSSLFQFIFTFLMEVFIEEYGWQGAIMITSALIANMVPLAIKVHEIEKKHNKRKTTQERPKLIFSTVVFKNIRLYLYSVHTFLFGFYAVIETRFLVDLTILRGYERRTGALLVTYLGMANFCARTFGVFLKIAIPGKNLLQMTLFALLNGFTHAIILFFTPYTGLLIGSLLCGFTFGMIMSAWTTAILEVFTAEEFRVAMVAINVIGGIGSLFDSFFGGYIQDVTNSYDLLLLLAIILSGFVVVILIILNILSMRSYRHICIKT